jgi:poly(hydroxyalkanoate) granule-associated protein
MKEKIDELQNDLKESAQKIWLAGLGAMSVAGEEGGKLFKNLVEKGEEFQAREKPPVEAVKKTMHDAKGRAEDLWGKLEGKFNEKVAQALQGLGVPTKEEIRQLTERVDALMKALDKMDKKAAKS